MLKIPRERGKNLSLSLTLSVLVVVVDFSVTRCWNNKPPIFFSKFPQSRRSSYYFKSVFQNNPKMSPNIWAAFVIKMYSESFQKNCPIWSHWFVEIVVMVGSSTYARAHVWVLEHVSESQWGGYSGVSLTHFWAWGCVAEAHWWACHRWMLGRWILWEREKERKREREGERKREREGEWKRERENERERGREGGREEDVKWGESVFGARFQRVLAENFGEPHCKTSFFAVTDGYGNCGKYFLQISQAFNELGH